MSRNSLSMDAQMGQSILYNSDLSRLGDIIFWGLAGLTCVISGSILVKPSKD